MNLAFSPHFDCQDLTEMEFSKLVQAVEVHGYRGPSKKRHNGVVPIRPSDTRLLRDLHTFLVQEDDGGQSLTNTCAVKVVAHVPSGKRLIGVMIDKEHVYIMGVSRY